MARTISVSDDVYEWMKRNKGDNSFSELIRDNLIKETDFTEVQGTGFSENWTEVEETVNEASENTMDKVEDRFS